MKLNKTELDFILNGIDKEIAQCEKNAKELMDRQNATPSENFESVSLQFSLITMLKNLKKNLSDLETESAKKEFILRTVESYSRR